MFRSLTAEEVTEYKQWVHDNWAVGDDIPELWHPVIRDECLAISEEATVRNSG